jgi:ankyrin repeat protein
MIQLFIESKVNLKAKDRYGLTALVYALKAKNTEIVDLIKNAGGSY